MPLFKPSQFDEDDVLNSKVVLVAALAALVAHSAQAGAWQYEATVDQMTDGKGRTATLVSENSLSLDFPYQGRNMGTLIVRQHPRHGLDVILLVDKGQIMCRSSDCPVIVRFDDAKPIQLAGTPPQSHDSNIVFLGQSKNLVAQAAKAHRILVQFNMFRAGGQTLEFKVDTPLEWQAAPAKKRKN